MFFFVCFVVFFIEFMDTESKWMFLLNMGTGRERDGTNTYQAVEQVLEGEGVIASKVR